jgi:hypothetical protein
MICVLKSGSLHPGRKTRQTKIDCGNLEAPYLTTAPLFTLFMSEYLSGFRVCYDLWREIRIYRHLSDLGSMSESNLDAKDRAIYRLARKLCYRPLLQLSLGAQS